MASLDSTMSEKDKIFSFDPSEAADLREKYLRAVAGLVNCNAEMNLREHNAEKTKLTGIFKSWDVYGDKYLFAEVPTPWIPDIKKSVLVKASDIMSLSFTKKKSDEDSQMDLSKKSGKKVLLKNTGEDSQKVLLKNTGEDSQNVLLKEPGKDSSSPC